MYLISIASAVSIDCPDLANFAEGLGMRNLVVTQILSDCCDSNGVVCVSERVTQINWNGYNLDGHMNGAVFPSTLVKLDLSLNSITGNIPSNLPGGLKSLYLEGNGMSGNLPVFPSSLEILYLATNGHLGNHFSGTLRMNRPIDIKAVGNWISDVIILDSSALGSCDFSNTPLLGNSNAQNLNMCSLENVYSPNLLPITITTTRLTTTGKTTTIKRTTSSTILKTSTTTSFKSVTTINMLTSQSSKISSRYSSLNTANDQPIFSKSQESGNLIEGSLFTVDSCLSSIATHSSDQLAVNVSMKSSRNSQGRKPTTSQIVNIAQDISPFMSFYILFKTISKLMIDSMILGYVAMQMPLRREWKNRGVQRKNKSFTD